jgi:8-oxo-dGTP pyrophosphatase MutT (NUDIX family)
VSDTRLYPDHPLIAVSLAVFKDGKVLLAALKETAASPVFSLPGGLVEIGETLHQAAIREVIEEIGITARVMDFIETHEIIDRDGDQRVRRHFIIHSFVGEWLSGEAQTTIEAPHVRWQDPFALGGIALTRGLQPILKKAAVLAQVSR